MKKKIIIAFAALSAIGLLSCKKADFETSEYENVNRQDRICFGIESLGTKASATEVTSLSSFNVLATTGSGTSEQSSWNAVFTKPNGSQVYSADKYWPKENPGFHFYGSNASITYQNRRPVVQGNPNLDIVCACLTNPSFGTQNDLTFFHIFSRIGTVTVNVQEGYQMRNLSMSINCPDSGTYDIVTGDNKDDASGWTAGSSTAHALQQGSNDIYVLPGEQNVTISYILEKGAWSSSVEKHGTVNLVKGKINDIQISANGGSASEITFSVTVKPWTHNVVSVNWDE